MTAQGVVHGAPAAGPARAGRRTRRPVAVLALVAAGYVIAQLLLVDPRMPLSFDEAVYASQFSSGVPRMAYAAHRSAGEALLAAPVAALTTSVIAMRAYGALVSGAMLFGAFLPWLRIRAGLVVPLAAALFAANWVALFYGAAVLPNTPVALGAVAATGLFVRAAGAPGDRRCAAALGGVVLGLTLLRPSDAVWICAPLVVAALTVRAWRRPAVLAATVAGLAAGWAAWTVEAFARFGDPIIRLRAINEISGGSGPYFLLARHLQAAGGRVACAPWEAACGPYRTAPVVLWAGGLLLVACGLYAVRRAPHRAVILLVVAQAAAIGVPYLVLMNWAVPRYLLPCYALLALPAAEGAAWLARRGRRPVPRAAVTAGVGAALVVSAGLQAGVTHRMNETTYRGRRHGDVRIAGVLHRQGVRPPCVVLGSYAPEVAYLSGCRAYDMPDGIGPRSAAGAVRAGNVAAARATGARVVLLVTGRAAPGTDASWRTFRVRGDRRRVLVSPDGNGGHG